MCFQREKGEAAGLEGRKAMQVFKDQEEQGRNKESDFICHPQ